MDRELERIRAALAGTGKRPLPPPPADDPIAGDLLETFQSALTRSGGVLFEAESLADAEARVAQIAVGRPLVRDGREAEHAGAETVGVDTADLLIAETGSVVRTYRSREESRVSLLPATSVFLARRDLLVGDLAAALSRLESVHRAGRAYTILITGPSRTADIEKELVIPAHGPRELFVILVRRPG